MMKLLKKRICGRNELLFTINTLTYIMEGYRLGREYYIWQFSGRTAAAHRHTHTHTHTHKQTHTHRHVHGAVVNIPTARGPVAVGP